MKGLFSSPSWALTNNFPLFPGNYDFLCHFRTCITAVCGDTDAKRIKVKGVLTGITQKIGSRREIGTILQRLIERVMQEKMQRGMQIGELNKKKYDSRP